MANQEKAILKTGEARLVSVDEDSGEVLFQSELGDKEFAAMMERARNAKKEEFVEPENDFWDPEQVGDEIDGIYVGARSVNNRIEHGVERESTTKKGKRIIVRFNGSKSLNAQLKGKEQYYVKVRWMGQTPIADANVPGKKFNIYKVTYLKLTN